MRLVSDFIAGLRHSLGKSPAAGHNLYHTLNDAGRRLYSVHPWGFLTRGPVALPVVANQNYLDLPPDFGGMLNLWAPRTGTFTNVEVVDLGAIGELRANTTVTITSGVMYVCFDANGGGVGQEPMPRALLHPTPAANGSPTMQMIYTRQWRNVRESDANTAVGIPEDFEDALLTGACLLAWNRENPELKKDPSEYIYLIDQLKAADGQNQPSGGYMRGGAKERMNRSVIAPIKVGVATL